tara:strand:+ start:86 stop:292 length:207 start_codon:yes stop_codon:yes gene_type:complete
MLTETEEADERTEALVEAVNLWVADTLTVLAMGSQPQAQRMQEAATRLRSAATVLDVATGKMPSVLPI